MSRLTAILFFCAAVLSAATVDFSRPFPVGKEFSVEVQIRLNRTSVYKLTGPGTPIERLEEFEIAYLGKMRAEKTDGSGNPLVILVEPQVVGGSINGKAIQPEDLVKRSFRLDLSAFPCRVAAADGKAAPTPSAQLILRTIFRSAEPGRNADFLGQSRRYEQGETWTPDKTLLLKELSARGLNLEEKNIKAMARFDKREMYNGVDCVTVSVECSADGSFSEDFRFKTRLILPVDPADGGYIGTLREGTEVVDWHSPFSDYMASGTYVQTVTYEKSSLYIVPADGLHKKKSGFIR